MEPTQSSETSAFNIQTPGKYPEDYFSLLQHGESLKTRTQHGSISQFYRQQMQKKSNVLKGVLKFTLKQVQLFVCFLLGNSPASGLRRRGITQKETYNI
jgi:hypothetical protein